jgi:phosphatidylglycerol:prolipoprotein diacylglycerol transferase
VHAPAAWAGAAAWLQIAAILLVLALSLWLAARRGLEAHSMYWAGVCGIVGALAGGRMWPALAGLAADGTFDWSGPRGVLGAFLGAFVAAAGYLRWRRRPVLEYADAAVPAVAIGYAVARLGCLLAGDDFGIPTDGDWGLRFAPGSEAYAAHLARGWIAPGAALGLAVHPTQLYHVVAGIAGFVLLLRWQPRWPGSRLAAAMAFYGATRLLIQVVRDDHVSGGQVIDAAQWFGIALIGAALALRWYQARHAARPGGVSVPAG